MYLVQKLNNNKINGKYWHDYTNRFINKTNMEETLLIFNNMKT